MPTASRVGVRAMDGQQCFMPTYIYEYLDADGEGTGESVEIVHSIHDDALTQHEGKPVRRVPQAPAIAGKMSPLKTKSTLSNENLSRLGFTKYERKGEGYMERTAGTEGPATLGGDD